MRRVVLLVLSGLVLGALLTGLAGALPGSQDLNALTWLGTVATVAALVVAVGIYRVQQSQSDLAHQELLDALKAQDGILQDLADATGSPEDPTTDDSPAPSEPAPAPAPRDPAPATEEPRARPQHPRRGGRWDRLGPGDPDEVLTAAQRGAVEARYGEGSIDSAWALGGDRGNRPRLVQLADGTLISVTNADRNGHIRVREVRARRERPRGERSRGPMAR